jgi:orotate phosphoribosyltransferase
MRDYQNAFLELAIQCGALLFGNFTLKSGRLSPYFFNSGRFDDGASIAQLGRYYAAAIVQSGIAFDMVYGPAYKGIPLAVATAIALHDTYRASRPYAFNRKEAKTHGEGGTIIGHPLKGRILIIDDVITAGTAIRESIEIIRAAGAEPCGVAISLDRRERGLNDLSAVEEVERTFGLHVISIASIETLIQYLAGRPQMKTELERIRRYQAEYGVNSAGSGSPRPRP